MTAMADDLRGYLRNEPISVRPESAAHRARKFVRCNLVTVILTTIAVAAITSGVVGIKYGRDGARALDR